MRNEFTAIVEQDGPWFVASCAEVPGANGQGKSREECIANLRGAIALIWNIGAKNHCAPCRQMPSRNS